MTESTVHAGEGDVGGVGVETGHAVAESPHGAAHPGAPPRLVFSIIEADFGHDVTSLGTGAVAEEKGQRGEHEGDGKTGRSHAEVRRTLALLRQLLAMTDRLRGAAAALLVRFLTSAAGSARETKRTRKTTRRGRAVAAFRGNVDT